MLYQVMNKNDDLYMIDRVGFGYGLVKYYFQFLIFLEIIYIDRYKLLSYVKNIFIKFLVNIYGF